MKKLFVLAILNISFFLPKVFSQKNHNINILVSSNNLDYNMLEINFIDGDKIQQLDLNAHGFKNEIILSNFKNPILEFKYKSKNSKNNFLRFFITELKSSIEIKYDTISDNIFF